MFENRSNFIKVMNEYQVTRFYGPRCTIYYWSAVVIIALLHHFRVIKPPLIKSGLVHQCCPSVRLFVCLSVYLSPKCKKTRCSQKLSNLELRCLLTTYRKLCNWAFQGTHYWIPKIQDG